LQLSAQRENPTGGRNSASGCSSEDAATIAFVASTTLRDLARRHGIELLLRFGSTVTGATHPHSDLDLGVVVRDPDMGFDRLAALQSDLQDQFGDLRVDLAILNRADPLFLKKVLERCELLLGDPSRLAELRCLAFRRYVDHRRFLDMERDYLRRRLGVSKAG
jgi:predicted nucleotidyltransferase